MFPLLALLIAAMVALVIIVVMWTFLPALPILVGVGISGVLAYYLREKEFNIANRNINLGAFFGVAAIALIGMWFLGQSVSNFSSSISSFISPPSTVFGQILAQNNPATSADLIMPIVLVLIGSFIIYKTKILKKKW